MAISIKSLNGLAAIKKLGVDEHLQHWLVEAQIDVKLTASEFIFKSILSDQHWSVEVTLDQLQKLNAGTLLPVAKSNLRQAVETGIAGYKKKLSGKGHPAVDKYEDIPGSGIVKVEMPGSETGSLKSKGLDKQAGALGALPELKPTPAPPITVEPQTATVPPKNPGVPKQPWTMFEKSKMKSATLVKLRDATQMYQPVQGTSSGSRYYMVAANNDLRIAARYKSGTLSIRIEGPKFDKYTAVMEQCGFSKAGKSESYASLHLEVGDDMMLASKTLGAVLLGLNVPLETPLPAFQMIV